MYWFEFGVREIREDRRKVGKECRLERYQIVDGGKEISGSFKRNRLAD
jgi:hypothetical protein